jgi:molybdopterin converting factor small subunit
MSQIRIPTPLRAYVAGQTEVEVASGSVAEALRELVQRFPALGPHLFGEAGHIRPYLNLFVNDQDVRNLNGPETRLNDGDRLMILPSIAGGAEADPSGTPRSVDHNALRANQASIIVLLLAAFLLDAAWITAGVGGVMWLGAKAGTIGFRPVYWALRRLGLVRPEVLPDNPEPHQFSQGLGALVLLAGAAAFLSGVPALGWGLVWLVIALASLNLFVGFCAGCAVYYWFNRLGLPGFTQAPPPGTFPGRRPVK